MGSLLGPALANIFVGFHKSKLLTKFPNLKSITVTSTTHLLSSKMKWILKHFKLI